MSELKACPFCGAFPQVHGVSGINESLCCHTKGCVLEGRWIDKAVWNIRSQAPMNDLVEWWQPIETCPKDGSYFWVYAGAVFPAEAYWSIERDKLSGLGGRIYPGSPSYPTHWMSVPGKPGSAPLAVDKTILELRQALAVAHEVFGTESDKLGSIIKSLETKLANAPTPPQALMPEMWSEEKLRDLSACIEMGNVWEGGCTEASDHIRDLRSYIRGATPGEAVDLYKVRLEVAERLWVAEINMMSYQAEAKAFVDARWPAQAGQKRKTEGEQ